MILQVRTFGIIFRDLTVKGTCLTNAYDLGIVHYTFLTLK
jgi:hypothetical protein